MADPIMATYVRENDDWAITVSGQGKELTARAPGIIAARDRTDQLVDKLGPGAKGATVVHLLNGSALEFTSMYMTARLARPEPAPLEVPEPKAEAEPAQTAKATETAEATEEAVVPAQPEGQADRRHRRRARNAEEAGHAPSRRLAHGQDRLHQELTARGGKLSGTACAPAAR